MILPTLSESLKEACLNVEKAKQRKDKKTHRYTSFLIKSGDLSHCLNKWDVCLIDREFRY